MLSPKYTLSATTSALRRLLPSLSFQSRICSRPSTTAMRPLAKYWQTNSAVWRQATTSMKSVAFSPLSRLLKSRSTAREKDVTAVPVCVRRSSGSRVRRPMITTRLSDIFFPPYSSLQTIMERMTPSVMRRIRSSSLGNSGALVKEINT